MSALGSVRCTSFFYPQIIWILDCNSLGVALIHSPCIWVYFYRMNFILFIKKTFLFIYLNILILATLFLWMCCFNHFLPQSIVGLKAVFYFFFQLNGYFTIRKYSKCTPLYSNFMGPYIFNLYLGLLIEMWCYWNMVITKRLFRLYYLKIS